MELLAMEMKRMGLYVCRTLSYEGSSFTMSEEQLSLDQRRVYDDAVAFIQRLQRELQLQAASGESAAAKKQACRIKLC
jgi:hypothetical protein